MSGSALSADSTAQPSMPGIMHVERDRVGPQLARQPQALLAAVRRVTTRKPSFVRKRCIRSRTAGSSSITSTGAGGRRAAGSVAAARPRRRLGRLGHLAPGSRMVKVVPRPGSLSTVTSPPIIWQNRRLRARPRPVPP